MPLASDIVQRSSFRKGPVRLVAGSKETLLKLAIYVEFPTDQTDLIPLSPEFSVGESVDGAVIAALEYLIEYVSFINWVSQGLTVGEINAALEEWLGELRSLKE